MHKIWQRTILLDSASNCMKYAYSPVYYIIAFLGIASNVLLLIAFIKDPLKCFRNSGTYLVMNLSISDLLTCLFVPFYDDIVIAGSDSVFELLALSFGSASLVSIASISIDRFLLVAHPFKHRYLIQRNVMVLWLSGIWLGSSTLPILRLFYGDQMKDTLPMNCFGMIVILLSAVMYATTYSKLKKHSKTIALQNSTDSRAREKRIIKGKNVLKTIILIACIACVCIVPSVVFFQLHGLSLGFSTDSLVSHILLGISQVIFYTNFAVNPLIYVLRLPNYRKTFCLIYCKRRS